MPGRRFCPISEIRTVTANTHTTPGTIVGGKPFGTAAWFPERYDASRGEIRLVATDRDMLAAQTFLDWRWDRAGADRTQIGVETISGMVPNEPPGPNFIWHTGFCCSTLLAKALDRPGRNLSLCEPQIMVDIADAKRAGALARSPGASVAELAFQLLARGFAPDEHVTLKPAPAANCLLHDAITYTTGAILVLYSDCRSFVVSIAKLSEQGRKYARQLFLTLLRDGLAQLPAAQIVSLSDLELAAIVWHMQIAEFRRNWQSMSAARAVSLDCDALLAAPLESLRRLNAHFSLGYEEDYLDEVVHGPIFRRNAKSGEPAFDARKRSEDHARLGRELGKDLDRIVAQSYALFPATPRGAPLADPLLQEDKDYSL